MHLPDACTAKGRAITARPSLRLLAVVLLVLGALVLVPAAQAAPPTPTLSGTEPESPGLSLEPIVHGSASEETGTFSFPGLRTSAITAGAEPGNTIQIYLDRDCGKEEEEEPTASASAELFEAEGIQITVEPLSTTWISANQENAEGLSGCSNAISYEQVAELPPTPEEEPGSGEEEGGGGGGTGSASGGGGSGAGVGGAVPIPPPAPPRLRTVPGGPSNQVAPLLTGSAPGAGGVVLYALANCGGSPVARVSPAQLAAGVPVRVVRNALTGFSGVSVGAGGASGCSAPVYYSQDSTRPHTRITMGPASKTRRRVAVFRFVDTARSGAGTRFLCRLNEKGRWRRWRRCRSPVKIRHLKPRRHRYVFRVRAVDRAGNRDRRPARRGFKVVRR